MGTIADFVAAFERDRSQYLAIEKDLEALSKDALRGIDFLWQSRVKEVKSLLVKLNGRNHNYKNESENVADACDLVAGRIILARWPDIEKVEEIVKRTSTSELEVSTQSLVGILEICRQGSAVMMDFISS